MKMDLRKEFEKEKEHDCYAYLQKYAGANREQDGFNDEYVEWLESKVNNIVLDDVLKCDLCGEEITDTNIGMPDCLSCTVKNA